MANTRAEKRKNNTTGSKIEPPAKALKKHEVLAQYKALQESFNELQSQNKILMENEKKNIEVINLLEETIGVLETKLNISKVQKDVVSSSAQTEIIRCEECEYPAEDMHDLVDHMHGSHPLDDYIENIKCNYCGDYFPAKSDLMNHIHQEHEDKVQVCIYFLEDRCTWGDSCWFSHDQEKKLAGFKCTICGQKFLSKSELMRHRKLEHTRKVKQCKNDTNGGCLYGSKSCWFNHTDMQNKSENNPNVNINNETNDIIKKLFDMMENFGTRIMNLEKI